jgi:prepilin-type N-terminal cleavage/methylation domain-containing protein
MKRNEGFTLIELMLVVALIAIIAAIAIPSLMKARNASNEASAISSLRTLTTANNHYRTRFQAYASALTDLSAARYIDDTLGSGTKSGYNFTYTTAGADTWSVGALPVAAGLTGDRGFFVDESGVIRFNATGSATSASNPID